MSKIINMNIFQLPVCRKLIPKGIALLLLGIGSFSCSDFLEPKSQSEFIPTTVEQLNELIISALSQPGEGHLNLSCGFLDLLTDDVETGSLIDQRLPTDIWYEQPYVPAVYAMYTWQPSYSTYMQTKGYTTFDDVYVNVYYRLVYVNAALDYIDRVSGSEEKKNYVKAQAYALRAFYYLHLVNVYGAPYNLNPDGPGIPVRTTAAKENRPMIRNTVKEVYDLIISDLKKSIDLFAALEPTEQYRQYRASMPMALLLLSRACLYMEDWSQAALYAQKLITDWSRFQIKDLNELIASNYSNVNKEAETTTNPDIRRKQLFYPDFVNYNNSDVIWVYGSASDIASLTRQDLFNATNSRVQNNNTYASLSLASRNLVNSYDANDLRLRTYFVRSLFNEPNYDQNTFSLSALRYRAYGKLAINDNGTGIPDMQNNRFLPISDDRTYGYSLRITEAYLILAEAQAMLGHTSEAMQALSAIWSKRFSGNIPSSYTSGSDAVEMVRKERRRELCFEALRWFDLRRWGMPEIEHTWYDTNNGDRQTFVLKKNDPGYTLPMPHTMLLSNADLTQVPLAGNGKDRKPE